MNLIVLFFIVFVLLAIIILIYNKIYFSQFDLVEEFVVKGNKFKFSKENINLDKCRIEIRHKIVSDNFLYKEDKLSILINGVDYSKTINNKGAGIGARSSWMAIESENIRIESLIRDLDIEISVGELSEILFVKIFKYK